MRYLALTILGAGSIASGAFGQYDTRFDDGSGWTFASNHATYGFDVDDDPAGHALSPPACLNVQFAEGEHVWSSATSPPIDLTTMSQPELTFWTRAEFMEDACLNDLRHLVVRDDATNAVLYWYCLSTRVPSGGPYVAYQVPLDPSWGIVRIEFEFNSVDGFFNQGDGWFVDNLSVAEGRSCPGARFHCWSGVNSAGQALLHVGGSTSVSANDLVLSATDTIPRQTSIFFFGPGQTLIPVASGWLCVAGPHRRLAVVPTGAQGEPSLAVDYGTSPGDELLPGTTWNFQCWYRDPGWAGPSNFTDAATLTFCP